MRIRKKNADPAPVELENDSFRPPDPVPDPDPTDPRNISGSGPATLLERLFSLIYTPLFFMYGFREQG